MHVSKSSETSSGFSVLSCPAGGDGTLVRACFTIPHVLVVQKIKMTVESHKPVDARGIELYVGSVTAENKIGESFKPTTIETYTWENWTLPEGVEPTDAVDIIVYNTSGCHIYNLEVGEDTGTKRNVGFIYNGDLSADLHRSRTSGPSCPCSRCVLRSTVSGDVASP